MPPTSPSSRPVYFKNNYEEKKHFNKPFFFKDINYTPRPDQWTIHMSKAEIRTVACGTRWGKSKLAAMEALSSAMAEPKRGWFWVVSPTYTLSEKVFREALFIARTKLREFVVDASESKMKLLLRNIGGYISEIWGKSADNPDSLLGEGLNGLIVDEAARIKGSVWESYLSQRLLDKRGWALLISTPKGRNWFYQMYLRGQDPLEKGRVASFSYPTSNNPLVSKDLLESAKIELPADVYKQEILAEFLLEGGTVFRNVEECLAEYSVFPIPPSPTGRYVMGVDLAKYRDFTVLAMVDMTRHRLCALDRFNQVDWAVQKHRIRTLAKRYNNSAILMDSTGVGDPIYEDLAREGLPVRPYLFTQTSRRQLIDNLVVAMENQRITIPDIPELSNELKAFTYTLTDGGHLKRSAPSGYHDDCVMALALAVWQMGQTVSLDGLVAVGETEFGRAEAF